MMSLKEMFRIKHTVTDIAGYLSVGSSNTLSNHVREKLGVLLYPSLNVNPFEELLASITKYSYSFNSLFYAYRHLSVLPEKPDVSELNDTDDPDVIASIYFFKLKEEEDEILSHLPGYIEEFRKILGDYENVLKKEAKVLLKADLTSAINNALSHEGMDQCAHVRRLLKYHQSIPPLVRENRKFVKILYELDNMLDDLKNLHVKYSRIMMDDLEFTETFRYVFDREVTKGEKLRK